MLIDTVTQGCDHYSVPQRSHQLSLELGRPLDKPAGESLSGPSPLPSTHPHRNFRDSLAKAMHEPELAFPGRGLALSVWVGPVLAPASDPSPECSRLSWNRGNSPASSQFLGAGIQ